MKKIIIFLIFVSLLIAPIAQAADTGHIIESREDITKLIQSLSDWFRIIVSVIAIIMLIYGGVLYMTAAGNEEKAKTARRLLTYAVIGIAVVLLASGAEVLIKSFLTV